MEDRVVLVDGRTGEALFLERTVEGVELTDAQPVQAHVP
jgi:hypothetical protein